MINSDLLTIINGEIRLKTDSVGAAGQPVIPYTDVVYKSVPLLNESSSASMNVNGSSVNVNFDFSPASGEIWFIEAIQLFIQDNGTTLATSFGAISGGLTNGVQILVKTKSTEYEISNLKNNIDINMVFKNEPQIPGTFGLFESSDIFVGELAFRVPIVLKGDLGDQIRIKIRDNLTGLDHFRARAKVWRINQ